MRLLCVSLCFLAFILLSACHKEKESETTPVFETREVSCNENVNDLAWSYTCQGTLLTRDNRYSQRSLIIWYEDVSTDHKGERIAPTLSPDFVLMSNGVATLKTVAYYSKQVFGNRTGTYDSDPGQPHPAWKILGFSTLEPAQVNVEAAK